MIRAHLRLATALLLTLPATTLSQDPARWEKRAQGVTVIRDDWGIPHTYAKSDADAVFGMMYAQAEDDFSRIEANYLTSLGRTAQAEGESAVFSDLRQRLYINDDSLKAMYASSPAWLKSLMDSWADGLNFYLYIHPEVKPKVITHFEPWMALSFSEGSIGGDIERISVPALQRFYSAAPKASVTDDAKDDADREPRGSNGFAIAPSIEANHRALLLINPHTSFFFRHEAQVTSDEGLDAYGASTWGQFFIYQGFNDRAGWMHTSSSVDNIDEYLETVVKRGDQWFYKYGAEERPVTIETIRIPFRTPSGAATREFTVFRTHHGPVVRAEGDKWVTVRMMAEPLKAIQQSYLRTKTHDYAEFRKVMELHTNSSNNTLFADAEGNIAYMHANFVPKRDTSFDWNRPVDGSNPATEWKGLHSVEESPLVVNPSNGWVYNTNNSPWSAAGPNSPKQANYPRYMDPGSESFRGLHAIRVLSARKDFTIERLREAAFDSYLTGFAALLPPLIRDYDATPASDPLKAKVAEQVAMLRGWDYRWSASSVPTAVAIYWGEALRRSIMRDARQARANPYDFMVSGATAAQRLQALADASDSLAADFGRWKTPWGHINRFQRLTDDIVHPFNDAAPSIPVPFPSAVWGSLASFGASPKPGTKKWYGTSGNSFVAMVEFGKDSVRAIAVTAGGDSGHPGTRHFNDQAERYAAGNLRPVYFYRADVEKHREREYHPGQ